MRVCYYIVILSETVYVFPLQHLNIFAHFSSLPMRRVSLQILTEDMPLVAQALASCGVFHPENIETTVAKQLPEQLAIELRHVFSSARNRLEKILAYIPFFKLPIDVEAYRQVTLEELQTIDKQLGDIWQQFSKLADERQKIKEQQIRLNQLFRMLEKFKDLDVDLRLLHGPKQFLNLHIGTIPINNLANLRESVGLARHFLHVFHTEENTLYCVIAGPLAYEREIQSVLAHAEFHLFTIPEQFQDYPQQVHADLTNLTQQFAQQLEAVSKQEHILAEQNYATLVHAYQILNRIASYTTLTESVRARGQLALVEGWIPQERLAQLEMLLNKKLIHPFVLTAREPYPEEQRRVPSVTSHTRFLAPYKKLVENYGTPRYSEIDPTALFALSFLAMFGMMFGDVGHGLIIAGIGWYFRAKLGVFKTFFISAGLSSTLFGLLYGSVFGVEDKVLSAIWLSPLHDPFQMLTIALYWGIAFIGLAIVITTINLWREGHYVAVFTDHNGIAGLCLYGGGIYAVRQWLMTDIFATSQQLAIVIPLSVILSYKWFENKVPFGERLLVTLIEGFEVIIKYFANTLSFLRVAAFSLNHVALAIAIFTLADMLGTVGQVITIVLGNLFIIGFEGAIVMIQILRLEYYEGFSRFFKGDGRVFQPLQIGFPLKG